jgi:hypothetical protein
VDDVTPFITSRITTILTGRCSSIWKEVQTTATDTSARRASTCDHTQAYGVILGRDATPTVKAGHLGTHGFYLWMIPHHTSHVA